MALAELADAGLRHIIIGVDQVLFIEDIRFTAEKMQTLVAEHGAEVLMEPADMFWGERFARVRDPFGHEWGIATRLREMTAAEIQAAAAKLFDSAAE